MGLEPLPGPHGLPKHALLVVVVFRDGDAADERLRGGELLAQPQLGIADQVEPPPLRVLVRLEPLEQRERLEQRRSITER